MAQTPNILLTNTSHDTSHFDSGCLGWNDLVERHIVVVHRIVAEGLHSDSQADFVAVGDLDGGILLLNQAQQHLGIHDFSRLSLHRLTETDLDTDAILCLISFRFAISQLFKGGFYKLISDGFEICFE